MGRPWSRSAGHRPHVCIDHGPAETAAAADQLGVAAPQAADRSVRLVGRVFQGVATAAASGGAEDLQHENGPPVRGKEWAHVHRAAIASRLSRKRAGNYKSAAGATLNKA